jgi:hypothetical protein
VKSIKIRAISRLAAPGLRNPAATNQKHAGAMEEEKERRCEQEEVQGKCILLKGKLMKQI